ncbi:MAG: DUF2334 domain-containing protein [Burkholderiaceae bacterium]
MQPSRAPERSASGARGEPLRAFCLSMHDVSPHTWQECRRLLDAVKAVADIPVTLLVVPAYHRLTMLDTRHYERALGKRHDAGHELALHGYSHLDEGPPVRGWRERFVRHGYTQSEGEFAALGLDEARRRIDQGLAWFGARGWSPAGFVAPAWLLSVDAWRALDDYPFAYTTTMRRFHFLPQGQGQGQGQALASRSLVYAARNAPGRWLSMRGNDLLRARLRDAPLVRFGLHPRDARHPELIAHMQRTIAALLETRQPMTKSAFVAAFASSAASVASDAANAPITQRLG